MVLLPSALRPLLLALLPLLPLLLWLPWRRWQPMLLQLPLLLGRRMLTALRRPQLRRPHWRAWWLRCSRRRRWWWRRVAALGEAKAVAVSDKVVASGGGGQRGGGTWAGKSRGRAGQGGRCERG